MKKEGRKEGKESGVNGEGGGSCAQPARKRAATSPWGVAAAALPYTSAEMHVLGRR